MLSRLVVTFLPRSKRLLITPGLENFKHYFTSMQMSAIVKQFEHSLALPFIGIGKKADLFQSCGHCWIFQICWHIEWSTFTVSSFRIWTSSNGIPPLALFIVMLPKAHVTSHSRMSGYRWIITPSRLSWVMKIFFVQFFCVFLPPLLNFQKCKTLKPTMKYRYTSTNQNGWNRNTNNVRWW